jgi:dipeptidyl aminopeptidase/acylaminoacyl peptidase
VTTIVAFPKRRRSGLSNLKKDGKTVDAHYYANEGRGFAKRENQIDSIRRSVEWFDKYLKGGN